MDKQKIVLGVGFGAMIAGLGVMTWDYLRVRREVSSLQNINGEMRLLVIGKTTINRAVDIAKRHEDYETLRKCHTLSMEIDERLQEVANEELKRKFGERREKPIDIKEVSGQIKSKLRSVILTVEK